MEQFELRNRLSKGKVQNFYIFLGDDPAMIEIFINQIAKLTNSKIIKPETIKSVYSTLSQPSLFDACKLFVVSDDKDFLKEEKAWESIETDLGLNYLIVKYTEKDERLKFFRQLKEEIVYFNKLTPERLCAFIFGRVKMSEGIATKLISICDNSYSRISLELDKLEAYLEAGGDVNSFLNTLYIAPKDKVESQTNNLATALLKSQPGNTFNVLEGIKMTSKEPRADVLYAITLLYNYFRNALQIQLVSSKEPYKAGLPQHYLKQLIGKLDAYSVLELVDALKIIREVEKGIKRGMFFGMDDFMPLRYICVQVLKKGRKYGS